MHVRRWSVRLAVLAWLVGSNPIQAQKKEEPKDKAGVLARTRSPLGTLFASQKDSAPRALELYSEISAGTRLFSPPGQRGVLGVKEGDLLLTLIGNLPEISPSPVLDTAVTLTPGKDSDVAVTLERGILLIEAGKGSEGGKVNVAYRDKNIGVHLHKGSAVAFELYRYFPQGTRFAKKGMAEPIGELLCFVLRGKVGVALDAEDQVLTGPVLYRWNTRTGSQGLLALSKMPEWANPSNTGKDALVMLQAAEKLRRGSEKNDKAWLDALKGKDVAQRIVGIYHAAALDRTDAILNALGSDADLKVRQAAITALRVYVGEGHDHADKLFQALVANKFKAGQAGIFLHLLLGFNAEDRNRAETYESLIGYLQHDSQAIRQLAADQLAVLVPAGKDIAYDAASNAGARMKAQAAWRKLIPEGSLPKAGK